MTVDLGLDALHTHHRDALAKLFFLFGRARVFTLADRRPAASSSAFSGLHTQTRPPMFKIIVLHTHHAGVRNNDDAVR